MDRSKTIHQSSTKVVLGRIFKGKIHLKLQGVPYATAFDILIEWEIKKIKILTTLLDKYTNFQCSREFWIWLIDFETLFMHTIKIIYSYCSISIIISYIYLLKCLVIVMLLHVMPSMRRISHEFFINCEFCQKIPVKDNIVCVLTQRK